MIRLNYSRRRVGPWKFGWSFSWCNWTFGPYYTSFRSRQIIGLDVGPLELVMEKKR